MATNYCSEQYCNKKSGARFLSDISGLYTLNHAASDSYVYPLRPTTLQPSAEFQRSKTTTFDNLSFIKFMLLFLSDVKFFLPRRIKKIFRLNISNNVS
jgi:hypothetical protein